MHHKPNYTTGIKEEKVTLHFSEPKAWELTHLPNLLLSALSAKDLLFHHAFLLFCYSFFICVNLSIHPPLKIEDGLKH